MAFGKGFFILVCVLGLCLCCYNPGPNDPQPPGGLGWINCTKPNESYSCGSACQNRCETLGEPCPIINIRCNDRCYCCPGFARDCQNNCIPENECPPKGSCLDGSSEY